MNAAIPSAIIEMRLNAVLRFDMTPSKVSAAPSPKLSFRNPLVALYASCPHFKNVPAASTTPIIKSATISIPVPIIFPIISS